VNADTGEFEAVRDDVAELDDHVRDLTRNMADILEAVIPILKAQVRREIAHSERTVSIRHTGRHRRDRLPPWCQS
jgi:hypothetical protein